MITTGLITEINIDNGTGKANKCRVEIDYFKTPAAANPKTYTFTANIASPGGLYNSYEIGDKVYVGFLNNAFSQPIILGHIYQGTARTLQLDQGTRSFVNVKSLNVENKATFSDNIEIGDLTYKDLQHRKIYQCKHLGYLIPAFAKTESLDIRIWYSVLITSVNPLFTEHTNQIGDLATLLKFFDKTKYNEETIRYQCSTTGRVDSNSDKYKILALTYNKLEEESAVKSFDFSYMVKNSSNIYEFQTAKIIENTTNWEIVDTVSQSILLAAADE